MDGVFSIISDVSNINLQYTNLKDIENLLFSHNSITNIKNNIYNSNIEYNNSIYSYNNSISYIDNFNGISRYIKNITNNFINFPNLTINCKNIDDISLTTSEINNYFLDNKTYSYYPNDILQFSPKFINNGFKEEWSTSNNTQYVRANIVLKLSEKTETAWKKLVNLISELPKNLNGKNLQVYFNINLTNSETDNSIINAMKTTPLIFKNFIGGTIQLIGNINENLLLTNNENVNFDINYPLNLCSCIQFENCSNINLEKLKFGWNSITNSNNNSIILSFVNCKRVYISQCVYINLYLNENSNNNPFIYVDNSNIFIQNSYFNFNDLINYYKGKVTNSSKVFLSETVFVYNLGKLNKNSLIKKFIVDKNSHVTWINIYDTTDKLLNNVSSEFNMDTLTNGIANHEHSNLLVDIGLGDLSISSLITNLTTSIPVGTTFYWPRAFTISNYTESITDLSNSLTTFPTNDENYNNYFINGYTNNNMNIIHNIPFLSGAIPLDNKLDNLGNEIRGIDNKTWSERWKDELNKLPQEIRSSDLLKINTSIINSKLFKLPENDSNVWNFPFKTIVPNFKKTAVNESSTTLSDFYLSNFNGYSNFITDKNKILNLAIINCNCTGPSVRTERADRFGYLDFFPATETNGCGFSITAGATHNWGGENQSEYRILDKIKNRFSKKGYESSNPFYYLNRYENSEYTNDIDTVISSNKYNEISPPHDEFWYSRQGLHIVYQIGFTDENDNIKLPEYLEYGYLKFTYNLIRNTNGLGNWYGVFMIADDYFIPYSTIHVRERSACGDAWPKEKYFPLISFKKDSKTIVKKSIPRYYDPEDIPRFGNYFLMNSGDVYLPLNKIAGKFLIFGMRGTYSTKYTEKDNGVYVGKYRGNSSPTETCSTLRFSDFKIIPSILPYKNNEETWKLSNSSPLLLNNIKANSKEDKISLAGIGLRYYTAASFMDRNFKTIERI